MMPHDPKKILKHPALNRVGGFKYYHILLCVYIAILITTSIMGLTFTSLAIPFTHTKIPVGTGTFVFPMLFIVDDIVTEVYGYAAARQMMWLGMFVFLFMFAGIYASMFMPIYHTWTATGREYDQVFGFMPRVVLSFIVGIFCGAVVNDYVMAKIKIRFKGRFFMARALGSSMVGELALQITGATVGLVGRFNYIHEILPLIAFAYCYKLIFDVFGMLISYPLQKYLKRVENLDYFDNNTNFNPFRFRIR